MRNRTGSCFGLASGKEIRIARRVGLAASVVSDRIRRMEAENAI
ncbi:MAG: winged helix-turn-helix transcriptional regulator [Arenibacterium sp.]